MWSCLPFLLHLSVFRTILEKMGLPQQAKNKWDNFKKKYKVGAGLNDDVEIKLYLFYPFKWTHKFLKLLTWLISTALGLQISGDRRGGQWEAQSCCLALVCSHGWGVRTEAFHCPPIPEDTSGPSADGWPGGGGWRQWQEAAEGGRREERAESREMMETANPYIISVF